MHCGRDVRCRGAGTSHGHPAYYLHAFGMRRTPVVGALFGVDDKGPEPLAKDPGLSRVRPLLREGRGYDCALTIAS